MFWVYIVIAYYFGGVTLSAGMMLPALAMVRNHESVAATLEKSGPWKMSLAFLKAVAFWPVHIFDGFKALIAPSVAQQIVLERSLGDGFDQGEEAHQAACLHEFKPKLCADCVARFDSWYAKEKRPE